MIRRILRKLRNFLLAEPTIVILYEDDGGCPFYAEGRCDRSYCHRQRSDNTFTCRHEDRGTTTSSCAPS